MISESLYGLAREFFQRRQESEQRLRDRLDVYCRAHPALLEARKHAAKRGVEAARRALYAEAETEDVCAQEAFESLLRATLLSEGRDPERFTYRPRCALCGDTGLLPGREARFCSCLTTEFSRRLKEEGGILPEANFKNFDLARFSNVPLGESVRSERFAMERLAAALGEWCERFFPGGSKGLLLAGGTGSGKTFSLHCVGNDLCDRGYCVRMTRAYELNARAASTFDPSWQEPYLTCDLLIVDDLGAEPFYQKITAELMYALLEGRRCAGRATAFATNLLPNELEERYGSRLYSRLIDRQTTLSFRLPGQDLRRKPAAQ